MSYQKYQTEALVLGNKHVGEADKLVTLYTRDFGLIRARASGIRGEKSKMRYALQNYSRAQVALVKGARSWRVAGSSALVTASCAKKEHLTSFARIAGLMTRLVAGEEKHEHIFIVISDVHAALFEGPRDNYPTIELMCVARILHALGYLSSEALGTSLFTHTAYEMEHIEEAELLREQLLSSVNRAMGETNL